MPPGALRVMGLDTALRKSGLAVVEMRGSGAVLLEGGVLRCPDAWAASRCLARLAEEVEAWIARHDPAALAVEGVFFCRNARTAFRLGEARGAAIACAARAGVPVFEYEPRRVKQAIVGRGGARKEQVAGMVAARLALAEAPAEDAADAMALALCHVQGAVARDFLGGPGPL